MRQYTFIYPIFIILFVVLSYVTWADSSLQHTKVLNLHKLQWKQRHPSSVSGCFSQKSRRGKDSAIMEMKHRDFCSGKSSNPNRRQERIILDHKQVRFLQNQIKNLNYGELKTLSNTQVPLSSGTRLEILNYVVTMQLGGQNMTVIVDTGSDLTWVQCQPCKSCYNQQEPLFNPSESLSYQSISCNSSTCTLLQEAIGNYGACGFTFTACNYYISYGDGSYSRGELGKENVVLGKERVENFVFGCGRSNKGLFGEVSGLMGLGKSDLSLVSQTSSLFGGVFSYCLPSSDDEESGSLTLGGNTSSYKNTTPISYTKMVSNPQLSSFYMLNLTGMSVGGVWLKALNLGQNGVLIDSGTVITRLPPSVYTALRAEFVKQFSDFPIVMGFSILDTCFNLSTYKEVSMPTVKMQFEGNAELNVDVNGVFYFVKQDASQVCLAFASLKYEDEVAIIGNYQQKNLRVVYDTIQSVVGFAQEKCAFV